MIDQKINKAVENDFFAVADFVNTLLNELDMCHPRLYSNIGLLACSIYISAKRFVDTPCEYNYIDIARHIEFNRGYLQAVTDLANVILSAGLATAIDDGLLFGGLHHDKLASDEYKREYLAVLANKLRPFLDEVKGDIHTLNANIMG